MKKRHSKCISLYLAGFFEVPPKRTLISKSGASGMHLEGRQDATQYTRRSAICSIRQYVNRLCPRAIGIMYSAYWHVFSVSGPRGPDLTQAQRDKVTKSLRNCLKRKKSMKRGKPTRKSVEGAAASVLRML